MQAPKTPPFLNAITKRQPSQASGRSLTERLDEGQWYMQLGVSPLAMTSVRLFELAPLPKWLGLIKDVTQPLAKRISCRQF